MTNKQQITQEEFDRKVEEARDKLVETYTCAKEKAIIRARTLNAAKIYIHEKYEIK